jgi:hypothetical protein
MHTRLVAFAFVVVSLLPLLHGALSYLAGAATRGPRND